MWKRLHKRIDQRIEKFTIHQAWLIHRHPYLLLMMPLLGVLAGNVKPIGRFSLSGPTHSEHCGCERIKLAELFVIGNIRSFE
jgi:hypothetical protein